MGSYEPGRLGVAQANRNKPITARETINGVEHVVVLEPDDSGRYREVRLIPVRASGGRRVDPAVFLG